MQYIYAISLLTENTLRVLQRLSSIFSRYRVNIEQMNVFETANKGFSYVNIIFYSNEKTTDIVIKQLQKIVELVEVKVNSRIPLT